MVTTRKDLQRWFEAGVEKGATHMSVHYDSFDCLDYPVYIWASSPEDARVQVKKGSSDRLIEVYHLASSMEHQLNEVRAFHYEPITIDEALDAPAEEP